MPTVAFCAIMFDSQVKLLLKAENGAPGPIRSMLIEISVTQQGYGMCAFEFVETFHSKDLLASLFQIG